MLFIGVYLLLTGSRSPEGLRFFRARFYSGITDAVLVFDCLEFCVEFFKMRLQVSGLRETCELSQGQAADQFHLRILGSAFRILVQYCARARVLQDLFDFAVEGKCHILTSLLM